MAGFTSSGASLRHGDFTFGSCCFPWGSAELPPLITLNVSSQAVGPDTMTLSPSDLEYGVRASPTIMELAENSLSTLRVPDWRGHITVVIPNWVNLPFRYIELLVENVCGVPSPNAHDIANANWYEVLKFCFWLGNINPFQLYLATQPLTELPAIFAGVANIVGINDPVTIRVTKCIAGHYNQFEYVLTEKIEDMWPAPHVFQGVEIYEALDRLGALPLEIEDLMD